MRKKYVVRLTGEERQKLKEMVTKGKAGAYKIRHANILLAADANGPAWQDKENFQPMSVQWAVSDRDWWNKVWKPLYSVRNKSYLRTHRNLMGQPKPI